MPERLQKIISASGMMSRRAAEELIKAGKVTVNNIVAGLGDSADADKDKIIVDGRRLPSASRKRYIMLNKPMGYVTTLSDDKGRKCVTELLRGVHERVYPIGRLDMYSEGLLLFTNDGDFANRVMHPSHETDKVYIILAKGDDIYTAAEEMTEPIMIEGAMTSPAGIEIVETYDDGSAAIAVTIHEGKNHQVRRLCERSNLKIEHLVRVSEGGVELGELPEGKWRDLNSWEIAILRGEE